MQSDSKFLDNTLLNYINSSVSIFYVDVTVAEASTSTVRINFSDLYTTLCQTLRDEQAILLLYMLLHRNEAVKAYVLSRTNIDQLVSTLVCFLLYHFKDFLHVRPSLMSTAFMTLICLLCFFDRYINCFRVLFTY